MKPKLRNGGALMINYRDLYFGLSDSANEYADRTDDFVKSYVDLNDTSKAVLTGSRTMVFGPKGAGKSALAYYLQATNETSGHISRVRDASSLPLADIPSLQTGQPPGVDRTVTAWQFIILCNLLDLIQSDGTAKLPNPREVSRVTRLLSAHGFMGSSSGRALLKVSSTTISIPIPQTGQLYKKESGPALSIYNLLPYLQDWASAAKSEYRHVLFLDGLDSIFLNDSKYDESLASLVQAAYLVNQRLRSDKATAAVVMLLRNDIFSRVSLRLPDSQKMRDDFGVELDWRILSGAAGVNSPLMRLVNGKASLDAGTEVNVLDFFPKEVRVDGPGGGRLIPTLQYLLNLTRHTPRDVLRIFEEIRRAEAGGSFPSSNGKLDQRVIREGVLKYAQNYFVNAIRNEFAGYEGGPGAAQDALTALHALQSQKFTMDEFTLKLRDVEREGTDAPEKLLRMLFFAGAIGNLTNNDSFMVFYHRRDDTTVYVKGPLVLHNALCHAWIIPFNLRVGKPKTGSRKRRSVTRSGATRSVTSSTPSDPVQPPVGIREKTMEQSVAERYNRNSGD